MLFETSPETESDKTNSEIIKSKRIIRILICLILLLLIAIVIILIFLFKKDSNSDGKKPSDESDKSSEESDKSSEESDQPSDESDKSSDESDQPSDESPFNIIEEDSEIHLIPKSGKYDYILIFIHGLTGNSNENLDKFNKKDGPIPDNFKIILPCAPTAYVTRLDFNTTSWFDILGINNAPIYEEDIVFSDMEKNSERIKQIIENEVKNVQNNYTKIFVGGFSQGACMSYHIGLSFEHTLGGIIPFCGIPVSQTQIKENNIESLNIFSIFGGEDIYISLNYSVNQTLKVLSQFKKLKINIFKDEPHAVKDVELEYVKTFIKSLI